MKQQRMPLTWVVIAVCALNYGVSLLLQHSGISQIDAEILAGAYYKPWILCGEWWRLLTAGFVHGGLWHLVMNMLALYSLGRMMEPYYGSLRYGILLLVSTVCGFLFLMAGGHNTVAVGLSGGLYGLMAAYFIRLTYLRAWRLPGIRRSMIEMAGLNLLINFLPQVAWQAHFGGFVCGGLLAMVVDPDPRLSQKLRRRFTVCFAVFAIVLVSSAVKQRSIDPDEVYLGTDRQILMVLDEHGMSSYSSQMWNRLLKLYGFDQ